MSNQPEKQTPPPKTPAPKTPASRTPPPKTPPPQISSDSDVDIDFSQIPGAELPDSDADLELTIPGGESPNSDPDLQLAALLGSDENVSLPISEADLARGELVDSDGNVILPVSAGDVHVPVSDADLSLLDSAGDLSLLNSSGNMHLPPEGDGSDLSGSHVFGGAAATTGSSSNLFGKAGPSGEPEPAAPPSSLEPLHPVQPSLGWFEPSEQMVPEVLRAPRGPGNAEDAIAVGLADAIPTANVDGSDIFAASGPIKAVPKSDVSDVIAATSGKTAKPVTPLNPSQRTPLSRQSDVALSFDRPPGGSTFPDPAADADLPVAEAYDSLFDDSITDAEAPPLARPADPSQERGRLDDADLGGSPRESIDASSILADLSAPGSLPGDSSAIRLEAPGISGTMDDELLPPEFAHEETEPEVELPSEGREESTDWRQHSDSNLFADLVTQPEFELVPDVGAVDPFDDDATAVEPSLSTSPSSIFTGGKLPGESGNLPSGGSSIPVANPESTDAVEFSDHPDPTAADSGSFHVLPPGSVDFDLPPEGREMDVQMGQIDDDAADWSVSPSDSTAETSGMLMRGKKPPLDKTDVSEGTTPAPVWGRDKSATKRKSDPSVVVDWVADSREAEAIPAAKSKPTPDRASRPSESSGLNKRGVAGMALGLLLGVGVSAGAYFSGVLPNKGEIKSNVGPRANNGGTPPTANGGGTPQPAPVTVADARAALSAGDPARAVKVFETVGAKSPEEKAALGQARFFARIRELAQTNAPVAADDAGLKQARADLEAVVADADAAKTPEGEKAVVKAALHLGLTHELAGDRAKAKETYSNGMKSFPKSAEVFQAALDRLAATDPDASKTSSRLTPAEAEQLASAVVILLALNPVPEREQPAPVVEEPAEAGAAFWKAVNLAAANKYDEAIKQISEAKKAHEKRAKALAGRGLNPLSDPLEQIFPRCCDDLKVYWELRKSLYEHPGVGTAMKKDGVAKTLDALAAAEKRSVNIAKTAADLKAANDTLAADIKVEKAKVATVEKSLKSEKESVIKLEKDLTGEKTKVAKLAEDVKLFEKTIELAKDTYKKNEAATRVEIQKRDDLLDQAKLNQRKLEDAVKATKGTLDAVAKDLQAGKLLPEKYDDAAVIAAARSAVSRATGPDLTKLVPPELSAIAGTGLVTGHLVDLAARVNKAEVNAKAAAAELTKSTAKFEADLAKLKTDNAADLAKLKTDNAAEVKKLTDGYKADAKKLTDDHTAAMKKLTDAQALELKKATDATVVITDILKADHAAMVKKLTDKYAVDSKKLTDSHEVALKKAVDANADKIKSLEDAVAAERLIAAGAEKRFKADLANAISPVQALDLWLPVLVELRRPSDADPALEAANKVLKTAPSGTEDAAKAQTVAGLALLLKGDVAGAKEMFAKAKAAPAYAASKEKAWVAAADVGQASITDPAAGSRKPLDEPRKNPLLAARYLDAGIAAYKAGRYASAEKALADAAWHDPDDALAWYFLGAARWAAGKLDDAKADFAQGALREKPRLVPVRMIDAAIEPIQGPARDALTAARP